MKTVWIVETTNLGGDVMRSVPFDTQAEAVDVALQFLGGRTPPIVRCMTLTSEGYMMESTP